jgi:hypothetical protein
VFSSAVSNFILSIFGEKRNKIQVVDDETYMALTLVKGKFRVSRILKNYWIWNHWNRNNCNNISSLYHTLAIINL